MRVIEQKIVTSGDMSGNITSTAQDVRYLDMESLHAVFTGVPVGTMTLEVSNDGTNFADYTGSSVAINGADNFVYTLPKIIFAYLRVKYTFTGGTGVLNVTVFGKGED